MDDEEIMRRIAACFLGRHGMKVYGVEDGEAGLELAAHKAFDLILIDLIMPGMCVETMLLRLHELQPGVPIIVVSGLVDCELGASLIDKGLGATFPSRWSRMSL